jgi:hypothetical protein
MTARASKTPDTAKTTDQTKSAGSTSTQPEQIFSPVDQQIYQLTSEQGFLTSTARQSAYDAILTVANDESEIGEFLGAFDYSANLAGFYFRAHVLGYRDWLWVSVLTLGKGLTKPEVLEVFMTPAPSALLPQPWVDWALRLIPDDANLYDELPYRSDDPNLTAGLDSAKLDSSGLDLSGLDLANLTEPTSAETMSESETKPISEKTSPKADSPASAEDTGPGDKLAILQQITQLYALSRERLLSSFGREQAAERWYNSSQGPNGPSARHAALPCSTCGFFVPLLGTLGQVFGVCSTNWSQDDGKVVSYDHGCGSHSESRIVPIVERYLGPALQIDEGIEWF